MSSEPYPRLITGVEAHVLGEITCEIPALTRNEELRLKDALVLGGKSAIIDLGLVVELEDEFIVISAEFESLAEPDGGPMGRGSASGL